MHLGTPIFYPGVDRPLLFSIMHSFIGLRKPIFVTQLAYPICLSGEGSGIACADHY